MLDAALAAVCLPKQADESEQQRKHVEHVASGVVFQVVGEHILVAETGVVDKRNAADPVAVVDFALTLQVVLTAGKIPEEVAPIHVIELVLEEVAYILRECRHVDNAAACFHRMRVDRAHAA